jgi:hypothetical protein
MRHVRVHIPNWMESANRAEPDRAVFEKGSEDILSTLFHRSFRHSFYSSAFFSCFRNRRTADRFFHTHHDFFTPRDVLHVSVRAYHSSRAMQEMRLES